MNTDALNGVLIWRHCRYPIWADFWNSCPFFHIIGVILDG